MVPGYGGGANWMGGAFDPETGMLYVPSMTSPLAVRVGKGDPNRTNLAYHRQRGGGPPEGPHGLPLIKPPYGRITAFDLNKGEKVWRATNGGDGPRDHPLLKHLNLPPLGTLCRAGALVTKTLLFVPEGSGRSGSARGGGPGFKAYDKATGEVLWETEFATTITNVPMTYAAGGKQFIVVGVGSDPPELVALSLP